MSKAFDSIDHNLLFVELQDVGASPLALQWFRSYLTARYQVVTIGTAHHRNACTWLVECLRGVS